MIIKKLLGKEKKYLLQDGRKVSIIEYNQGLIKPLNEQKNISNEINRPVKKKRGRKKKE